jgi:hypothetical protein
VVIEIELFISCAQDVEALRNTAQNVIHLLDHMLRNEMGQGVFIGEWDFRVDAPRVVAPEDFSARSLKMVERSSGIVAIMGDRIGDVSKEEIRRAFEMRRDGMPVMVWTFLDPAKKTQEHEEFVAEVLEDFNELIVYTEYRDELEFQGKLFVALIPHLLQRVETTLGPLFSVAVQ